MSGGDPTRDDGYKPTAVTRTKGAAGGGAGGSEGADPCDIVDLAPLNSPQPAVIVGIAVGDVLDVNLDTSGTNPVLEVLSGGRRAGALTHRNHVRIINCIAGGRRYRAVVIAKRGGSVEVRVEPA